MPEEPKEIHPETELPPPHDMLLNPGSDDSGLLSPGGNDKGLLNPGSKSPRLHETSAENPKPSESEAKPPEQLTAGNDALLRPPTFFEKIPTRVKLAIFGFILLLVIIPGWIYFFNTQ